MQLIKKNQQPLSLLSPLIDSPIDVVSGMSVKIFTPALKPFYQQLFSKSIVLYV